MHIYIVIIYYFKTLTTMKIILPSLFLVVLFTIVFASFNSNSKYETASYSVKKEVAENVEVRLYENLMLLTNYSSADDNENDADNDSGNDNGDDSNEPLQMMMVMVTRIIDVR